MAMQRAEQPEPADDVARPASEAPQTHAARYSASDPALGRRDVEERSKLLELAHVAGREGIEQ